MPEQTPRLQMISMSKRYGGVRAVDDVTLEVSPGEVHGLVGENGAGKSTMIRCAAGTVIPDAGRILVDGREVQIESPKDSRAAGIAVVHQEAELFGHLSLAENMFLGTGLPRRATGLIDWPATYRLAEECLARLGESMDVRRPASHLSVAQRMIADIAAALYQNVSILFLDEPSASLTRREVEQLFTQVRRLRGMGVSVVFVSHRLEEVRQLCDRVTVMRDGQYIWTKPTDQIETPDMVAAMVGRDVDLTSRRPNRSTDDVVLEVDRLTDAQGRFQDVTFALKKGEVLGVYGLVGAGRTELAHALFGVRETRSGDVTIRGERFDPARPSDAVDAKIAYVPEDRLVQGVFGQLSVCANAAVTAVRRWSCCGLVSPGVLGRGTQPALTDMRVKMASAHQPIRTLSGGNQQKVVVARWMLTDPDVLIVDEPTRGVDIGAKVEIHGLIDNLAARGKAVLMISSDLPEIMQASDRVMVFREGRVAGFFDPQSDSAETIAAAALPDMEQAANADSNAKMPTRWLNAARELGLLGALFLLVGFMCFARPDSFMKVGKFIDIGQYASILSLLAIGATFVIAVGGIDISVGSMLALVAVLAGTMAENGAGSAAILMVSIAIGTALGVLNAGASLIGRIHPIIVTLAGLSLYRGLALWLREDSGEIVNLPESIRRLGHGSDPWIGLPVTLWYAVVVAIASGVFLRSTRTGRSLLAVGDSVPAADLAGLPRRRLQLLAFGLSGALVGLAAVLTAAYEGAVLPSGTGKGRELQAIAAAVIGGCAITGGRGSALGTVTGTLLIATIYSSLVLLGIPAHYTDFAVGAMILVAVVFDSFMRREEQ